MRPLPFGMDMIVRMAIITAAPILPLTLTMMPLEKRVDHLLKAMF